MAPTFLSVVDRCPLYGGVIFCHTIFWNENICHCRLFGGYVSGPLLQDTVQLVAKRT